MEEMEQDKYFEEETMQVDKDEFSQEGISLQPTPLKLGHSSSSSSKTPVLACKGTAAGGGVLLVGTPLTPTANLKVLMSAVSPALREKERQEKQKQQASKVSRDIFASCVPKEPLQKKAESDYDRKTKSLGLLCRKFLKMTENEIQTDAPFSLEAVANALGINRRRIYDIINVFESLELAGKHSKNLYVWYGIEKLPITLAKLKAIAEFEGPLVFCDKPEVLSNPEFRWRMQGSCLLDNFPLPSPLTFDSAHDDDSHTISAPPLLDIHLPDLPPELVGLHRMEEDDDTGSTSGGGGSSKNDRSLGLLCQKFIMLLLVLPKREVTLDFAAQVILADDETIDMTGRAKPKVRRLYDIANVLVSMGLIAKDSYINTSGGYHKPGFYWVGPDITDVSHIRVRHREDGDVLKDRRCGSKAIVAIQGRRHWCQTKHSLLNCYDIEVDSVEVQAPSSSKRTKSYSAPTSPLASRDFMDVLPKAGSGNTELNSLEVEAVLFGNEMKSLQDKYPNIYSLFGDFLKNNCKALPIDTPSVLRNPVESDDKNEPMYIFRNFTAAARKSHSRSSSEGGAQSLTPSAKRPKVVATLPSKQTQTSSLATHFTSASKHQKGKQRRSSESVLSATPPKPQSDLSKGSLATLERQSSASADEDWSDSARHRLLVKPVPEMGIPLVSLAGGQQSCDTASAPLVDPAVLPGQQRSSAPQDTTISPSIFLNFPRFPLQTSLTTSPRQAASLSGGSRVLVQPLGNVLGVGPAGPPVSVHQMLPASTCPDLPQVSSSPTLASILSTLAPLLPPPPNTSHTGQRQELEGQGTRTASHFSSTSHAVHSSSSLQQTQRQVITDENAFTSDVVAEVVVPSDSTPQSSQAISSPISSSSVMVPIIMNSSKPPTHAQPQTQPQAATPGQQDMLCNLQNTKLLQSLLQVASTLPTQPLLPMGQVPQGLSAPLNLQSLLQGVPPASSGYLPMAQPLVHLDTMQLAQLSKPSTSPYLVRSSALPPINVPHTIVASSVTLPVHQTHGAPLSNVTGAGEKTASTALPLKMSVGSLKSATPQCPKRTPLAQLNTNVTPVQDTFSLLKPVVRATEGRLPGVVGYHGSSPLLPPSNPVMLREPCSVGYGRGSQITPLGDQSTRGQRETQSDKETV